MIPSSRTEQDSKPNNLTKCPLTFYFRPIFIGWSQSKCTPPILPVNSSWIGLPYIKANLLHTVFSAVWDTFSGRTLSRILTSQRHRGNTQKFNLMWTYTNPASCQHTQLNPTWCEHTQNPDPIRCEHTNLAWCRSTKTQDVKTDWIRCEHTQLWPNVEARKPKMWEHRPDEMWTHTKTQDMKTKTGLDVNIHKPGLMWKHENPRCDNTDRIRCKHTETWPDVEARKPKMWKHRPD